MPDSVTTRDDRRLRISLWAATALTILILAYNVFHEYFLTDVAAYLQRKLYYESVISQKGLSLHKGEYWREKE